MLNKHSKENTVRSLTKHRAEVSDLEIKDLTVPEIEKLFGAMKTDYKLENKGGVRLHTDCVKRSSPRNTLEAIALRI